MNNYGYNSRSDGLSIVRGFDLSIESGVLIFAKEGIIELAIAAGEWLDVWLEADDD